MADLDPNPAPPADPALNPDPDPPTPDAILTPPADPAPLPGPAPGDDWRGRMAGEDEKLLGFLGRYPSEKAFVEAAKKDRDAIRTKQGYKLPEDPSAEELAEYRKQQGVPEKPEGYLEKLPDGLVVGADDRPFVDVFLEKMHAANAPKGISDAALTAYYQIVEDQAAEQSQRELDAHNESISELTEEWGKADYKRNVNVTNAFISTLPEGVGAALTSGKDAAGLPMGSNPAVVRWLAGLALEANPLATVVPGAGANAGSAIADEIASIEKTMRENRAAYNKDEKMQSRYRDLIDARLKLEAKG